MKKEILQDIQQGLKTAYIDGSLATNLEYKPSFVSNNPREGKKVISSIEEELERCESFKISVAFITMGGVTPLLPTLQKLEKKGVKGEILTTNYLDFSEPRALERLNEFTNITIKMYCVKSDNIGFHTKGYIFKKEEVYRIILGSSNMTSYALTSNFEWNTKIISTEQGELTKEILNEFDELWYSEQALEFGKFFKDYKERYDIIKHQREEAKKDAIPSIDKYTLKPNSMQVEFIANLRNIIDSGNQRALLISATGTGKTFASAFAMREMGFKRVLFVVHRAQLAKQAKESYERVFNDTTTMGIVGNGKHEYNCDFVFAMVETLNRDEHLFKYSKDAFDCIILDEAHHSPANTYQKIMEYFTPQLFLGMTATPDKRDDYIEGRNVYELFDYQIALEIRLQKAMEDDLLCPFHYFGITDITMPDDLSGKGKRLSERDFNLLTSEARVDHVIKQAKFYEYSGERVKGLIFCSRNDECKVLSQMFNERGYRTLALSNETPQKLREEAFERLAMNEEDATDDFQPLDYIFSVDILNEGIDIVEVNQVIMLRPTQSPIVFIQQLGRGLRKAENKEYVVILDFIGNYENNFMIPVALSGDRTYNSDIIRKYVISGNSTIPGASTIHFDEISKDKIFKSIDNIKSKTYKQLIKEGYINLKNKLGRCPLLIDFYENYEVDPLVIIREYKSYFSFIEQVENSKEIFNLTEQERLTLEYLSKTILSGIRPDELEILRLFFEKNRVSYEDVITSCRECYGYEISTNRIDSAVSILRGEFVNNSSEKEKYSHIDILKWDETNFIERIQSYADRLTHKDFYEQIRDIISVGLARYKDKYAKTYKENCPFVLYEKYSRRDICLLMDAGKDLSSTMYGMSQIGEDVFIFVTYHKEENTDEEKEYIDGKPDYADEFVDNVIFRWDSQIDKRLDGAYMDKVLHSARRHLLVQKTDAENNFFYMGEFDIEDVYETLKKNNRGIEKPICKVRAKMHTPVRDDLLRYLQNKTIAEDKVV